MNTSNVSEQKIFELIEKSKHILIVSHARPDGDTIGASLAFSLYLKSIGKVSTLFCKDTPPSYFAYLPHITSYTHHMNEVIMKSFDLIIVIDHSTLTMSGIEPLLLQAKSTTPLINIDHHASNEFFGTYNYVQPKVSSACAVVTHILNKFEAQLSQQMATCLMTGLITDTGIFMNSATDTDALLIAQQLINAGAKIPEISTKVMQNKNIAALNLWGTLFERLTINPEYNLAYTVLLKDELTKFALTKEAMDGFVNYLSQIKDVDLVLFLQEEPDNKIKGSFRTTKPDIDVAKLASIWGGGGHTKAAGFTMEGRIEKRNGMWEIVN